MSNNIENDEFLDKVFKCNDSKLTRRDLESFPAPFCTKNTTDEMLQEIINLTDRYTRQALRISENESLDFKDEETSETWWRELEEVVEFYDIPYYEDIKEDKSTDIQEYDITTFFIFKGVFTIKATSEDEAKRLVKEQCGLVLGGGIHSTIDEDDVDWNFDMHPEQVIKSIKRK